MYNKIDKTLPIITPTTNNTCKVCISEVLSFLATKSVDKYELIRDFKVGTLCELDGIHKNYIVGHLKHGLTYSKGPCIDDKLYTHRSSKTEYLWVFTKPIKNKKNYTLTVYIKFQFLDTGNVMLWSFHK